MRRILYLLVMVLCILKPPVGGGDWTFQTLDSYGAPCLMQDGCSVVECCRLEQDLDEARMICVPKPPKDVRVI